MFLISTKVCVTQSELTAMYVCICNNVTERDIELAVRAGARSLACLARELAVSTSCGQCRCVAGDVLHEALRTVGGRACAVATEFASAS